MSAAGPAVAEDRARAHRWIAFGACVLAGLSNEVSGGALSLSMRDAAAELSASTAAMQLVMTLSKLLFGAFMLLGGVLGDTYGRRRVLVIGCFGVAVASAMAALSASTGARILPEGMERQFEEAFREAFTVGVARVFAVGALLALGCAVLIWFGVGADGRKDAVGLQARG